MRTFACVLLAALTVLPACGGDADSASQGDPGDARRPDVTLVDADRLLAMLAAHRGRGLLVNLWAMW